MTSSISFEVGDKKMKVMEETELQDKQVLLHAQKSLHRNKTYSLLQQIFKNEPITAHS